MNTLTTPLRRHLFASVLGLAVSLPISAQGGQNDVVLLWGEQSQGETLMGFQGFGYGASGVTAQQACSMARNFIDANLPMLPGEFDSLVVNLAGEMGGLGGAAAAAGALADLDDCANDPDPPYSGSFYLIFTSCSMIMGAGTQWMRWTVPPFAEEASMVALDSSKGEAVFVPLETRLGELNEAGVGTGDLTDYSVSGPAGEKPVMLRVSGLREFSAQKYDFSYRGSISVVPGMEYLAQVGVNAKGHSWVVPDAPGADVISTFYSNFRDNVAPAAGMASVMTGMVRQMADIAAKGIPVETTHTSSVSGGSMALMAGAGAGSTSTSTIKAIMVLPGRAAVSCPSTVVPEGMEVMDINEMMSGAGEQAGAGAPGMSPEQATEMSEAMSAMQEAMQQMTPEQQAMMRNLGIQLPAQAPAANPAGSAAAGAAAAGSAASRSMPSSADLTTGNLTQTVQLHLQALGYDVGNTDGEVSLETTIAISQFQAEKGMQVTGEVSPQLAGILAAEVDSQ